jgi:hypothetical protein
MFPLVLSCEADVRGQILGRTIRFGLGWGWGYVSVESKRWKDAEEFVISGGLLPVQFVTTWRHESRAWIFE